VTNPRLRHSSLLLKYLSKESAVLIQRVIYFPLHFKQAETVQAVCGTSFKIEPEWSYKTDSLRIQWSYKV